MGRRVNVAGSITRASAGHHGDQFPMFSCLVSSAGHISPMFKATCLLSSSSSRSLRKCTLVAPEGPAAAPRRAARKQARKASSGSGQGMAGRKEGNSGGKGSKGRAGRRAGSLSAPSIVSVPGAKGVATSARPAAKRSPK